MLRASWDFFLPNDLDRGGDLPSTREEEEKDVDEGLVVRDLLLSAALSAFPLLWSRLTDGDARGTTGNF